MKAFTQTTSAIIPLLRDNVDTDAIIPSREIRSVSKKGLADGLFAGWRYADENRTIDPEFVLNKPEYQGATILATGENLGCGSSREQAVWALVEYGINVAIAPSFNSIFRRNCIRNGVLPIQLDPTPIVAAQGPYHVDLTAKSIQAADGQIWHFELEEEATQMLLLGLDEIEMTLTAADKINAFRAQDQQARPWAYL